MFQRFKLFFQESHLEFKRVNWPSRQETTRMVIIVVSVSLVVAVILGSADLLFLELLEKFFI